jgi:hypothetical protein
MVSESELSLYRDRRLQVKVVTLVTVDRMNKSLHICSSVATVTMAGSV